MDEGPLTDHERIVLRAMMKAWTAREARDAVLHGWWTRGRLIVVGVGALTMWLMTLASALLALRGR